MPTLAQLRTVVDDRLEEIWPNVVARQATFFANQGRYWQGLITCELSTIPDNSNAGSAQTVTANFSRHPTDQASTWADVAIDLGAAPKFAAQIDVLDSPAGPAFVATIYARHNGNIYRRSRGSGPGAPPPVAWEQLAMLGVAL